MSPLQKQFDLEQFLRRTARPSHGQAGQKFEGKLVIVRFASYKSQTDREPVGIDHRMNLVGQSASRPAHGLLSVSCDAGRMLAHSHNGRVDHLSVGIGTRPNFKWSLAHPFCN
jgi:hypothetical protein